MTECNADCASCGLEAADQPPDDIEFFTADGVFIKQMLIAKAGTYIPQHSHRYDHVSMLATGSVRVWADGALVGDYAAPAGIPIAAKVKHTFLALEDRTIVYCIHNVSRSSGVEVVEEHQLLRVV